MNRIYKMKLVLWVILGIAAAVAITRFIFGLGATTNLTDNTPWGFWIGFDVMGGVALAAGGFVIAAFNYIFGKKQLHPISRAAILTAFLGYVAVAVGLLFDLGLPWNIWHMIIYWNPHSPLFEVGWCVMLYLTVLFLEFMPVVLEKYPNINILKSLYNGLYKIRIPLVILGIMLSTLHQSSLGSLFLAMPYRLHPLWYSPIIPIIFFVSAICLGLMMVMVESLTTSWLYHKPPEKIIVQRLTKYAVFALIFYLVLRFADILVRGAGVFLFDVSWGTFLFWLEMLISVFIPITIFLFAKNRISILYLGALTGVIGVVFNRLNVGGLTHLNNLSEVGTFYFPSLLEFTISAGVVSLAMLVFFYFIENYKVWEEKPEFPDDEIARRPVFSSNLTYLGPLRVANRTKFSFAFVIAFAVSFASISGETIYSKGLENVKVVKARGGDTLYIDGNRDDYSVFFKHKFHSDSLKISCGSCHHLNKPDDKATGCYECHYNMYTNGDAFKHDWHTSASGANLDCYQCHDKNFSKGLPFKEDSTLATKLCGKCHQNMIPADAPEGMKIIKSYVTVSYTDAMHKQCIDCHQSSMIKDTTLKARKPNLALCVNCHPAGTEYKKDKKLFQKQEKNKWVVIPSKLN